MAGVAPRACVAQPEAVCAAWAVDVVHGPGQQPDDAARVQEAGARGGQGERCRRRLPGAARADAGKLHEREREYREGPLAGRAHTAATAVCGKIEAELAELPREEQQDYLASYGLQESGLERLISATYSLLGLMSFLTAGEDECRAWTIPMNSTAVKAAGAIHSDFEKKFIRAEVVNWKTLVDLGGYAGAREKGQLRLEGKEYIVKDGDVLVIRHS